MITTSQDAPVLDPHATASLSMELGMSKQQMIERIRERNRSASNEFLVKFDEEALQTYLSRLTTLQDHRGRSSVWVRKGVAPASVMRACA
jgi:hypothetical protein